MIAATAVQHLIIESKIHSMKTDLLQTVEGISLHNNQFRSQQLKID